MSRREISTAEIEAIFGDLTLNQALAVCGYTTMPAGGYRKTWFRNGRPVCTRSASQAWQRLVRHVYKVAVLARARDCRGSAVEAMTRVNVKRAARRAAAAARGAL